MKLNEITSRSARVNPCATILKEFEDDDYLKLKAAIESVFDIEKVDWQKINHNPGYREYDDDAAGSGPWWVFETQGEDKLIYISVTPNIDSAGKEFGIILIQGSSKTASHYEPDDQFIDMDNLHDDENVGKELKKKIKELNTLHFKNFHDKAIALRDALKKDGQITYQEVEYQTPSTVHNMSTLELEVARLFTSIISKATIELVVRYP